MRERIAHLLADWRRSKDTDDPMVLRVAATMAHHQLEEADSEIEDLEFRMCGTQGELENALLRERTLLREQEDCRIGADNLDAEIERLRAERDEARREVSCLRPSVCLGAQTAVSYAKSRGWDCFKDESKPHRCGLCDCECEPVNDKGDCRMCERAQYGS